jgi:hypothetical protein
LRQDDLPTRFPPRVLSVPRILTIPRGNPVNAYTMGGIVRDAGLTIEEFRELL